MVIYKIMNRLNGKPYIGQTRQPLEKRFLQHAAAKTPLGDAMRKCGLENFTIEAVEECATPEQTKERERFWIKVLKCKVPNGYNQSDGGESVNLPNARNQKPRFKILDKIVGRLTVAEALYRFRREFNLKQKDVATLLGITNQAYQCYEYGKAVPSTISILKLAKAFSVTTDYVLGLSDEPRPVKHDNEQEIKAAFEFRDKWQHILKLAALDGLLPQPVATA